MKKIIGSIRVRYRKAGMTLFFALAGVPGAFAQSTLLPQGLNDLPKQIYDVFKSDFIKFILICLLCGCAVTYAFNKDNEKIKKNIIAIGVAAAILMAAQFIVGKVMDLSKV
jgi:hypothetical protein